jgi:integrase
LHAPANSRDSPSLFIRTCCAHSAGYKLANEAHDTPSIQQYLGHRNITQVRYTELRADRFKGFWKDWILVLSAMI